MSRGQTTGPSPGPHTCLSRDPDLTIVLLGNSGVGKSASGNTILGRAAFESKQSFVSVTRQISEETGTVFGKQLSVVDTPGIFGSEEEIEARCQRLLQSFRACLFLVVVKIDRFTTEQKNAVEAALRVVRDDGFNNCYLLFTGGDKLCSMSLDEFISNDPEGPLKPLVERFAGRHHVFYNENGGQEQVRELLKKSGHLRRVASLNATMNRRIVLLGLPGYGKSASGNTILGSDQFESASGFRAVSTETVSKSAKVEGRQVTVVDTPGFTGKVLSPKKLYLEIMKSVVEASPGPHVFIVVVRIGRISEADVKLLQMLPKLFSKDCPKYTMVLFTHGDALEGQSIEDLIRAEEHVSQLVSRCGDRFCVFDNKQRGNREQVRKLMEKIDEMVSSNGGNHYTSGMFYNAQTIPVKISKRWDEICEWFTEFLREFDCCSSRHARIPEED